MKKISLSFLIIILLIFLISCTYVSETIPYEFVDHYEETISNVATNNENSIVGLIYNKKFINSGFIFKKTNELNINHYYVLTTYEEVKDEINKIEVVSLKNNNIYEVKNYTYDENLNLAVFVFHTVAKFSVTKLSNNDAVLGQNVLNISAPSNTLISSNARLGIVSRVDDDFFMFDSKMNIGDVGGPVLNLDGEAIGIFTNYLKKFDTNNNLKYGDGINQAYKLANIKNYLDNLAENTLNKNNKPFEINQIVNNYTNNLEYELKQQETANIISTNTIYIKQNDELLSSGVIVKKDKLLNNTNDYYILTKYNKEIVLDKISVIVNINSSNYNVEDLFYSASKNIIILKINSNLNYEVANTSNILKLEKGQSILTNGIQDDTTLKNYVTAGIVAKIFDNEVFMIDAPVNPYQMGGGIYSYNGDLLGIIINKMYSTKEGNNLEDELNVEGISFGVKYSSIANIIDHILEIEVEDLDELDLVFEKEENKYLPLTEHELLEINLVENNLKYVVTVIGESGHGSGTIFKKEKIDNNKFLYYVLTNSHVIKDSEEISILFPDGSKILAKDFHNNNIHDTAVIRFESTKTFEAIDVSAINDEVGVDMFLGQIVFTFGTPLDLDYYGYVTRGIISTTKNSHNAVHNLTLVIDAPLNPGNSGGSLFNLRGEFIGVNVAKLTVASTYKEEDEARGLGLTLNMNVISPLIRNISSYKEVVKKPRLGITVTEIENIIPEMFEYPIPENQKGLVVLDIDESRGSYGKLEVNDILIKIDGKKITNTSVVANALANAKFGDEYLITFLRYIENEWVEMTITVQII